MKLKRLKFACYTSYVTMAIITNFPPLLFLIFRNTLPNVSFTKLGLLVLINYFTQLIVDLLFSFFSHRFHITKTVRGMPIMAAVGLLVYALWPHFLPQTAYTGLVIGTILFSASSGLIEVLISPIIAALPSEHPERDMSRLHSFYAWGVVFTVILSTLALRLLGDANWYFVALIWMLVPLISAFLFAGTQIPTLETPKKTSGALKLLKNGGLWLCFTAIFLGGASECSMAQWASGYLEQALGIQKVWGDVFGVALFGGMMALGRTLYAKRGKHITAVMLAGGVGASACYLIAAFTGLPIVGLAACAFTGFCTSMMWPGSLSVVSERFNEGGVFVFAMMAAAGDLGASVGPQLIGMITDGVIANRSALEFAQKLSLTPDQLGMKAGLLIASVFPIASIFVFACMHLRRKRQQI